MHPPNKPSKIRFSAKTDVGKERKNNEDNFIICSNLSFQDWSFDQQRIIEIGDNGVLLILADGMGGLDYGEVASEVALESIREYFETTPKLKTELSDSFIEEMLKEGIQYAHQRIVEKRKSEKYPKEIGTTIIICWLKGDKLYCVWSGDSRCYLYNSNLSRESKRKMELIKTKRFTDRNLIQISKDHSVVQELIDNNNLTAEQAFYHPDSNLITQSLGNEQSPPKPDFISFKIQPGDRILLCSDGLNGMLQDGQISKIIRQNPDINKCTDALVIESNNAGGQDNVTVILADLIGANCHLDSQPIFRAKKYVMYLSILMVALLLIFVCKKHFKQTGNEIIMLQNNSYLFTKNGDTLTINESEAISNIKTENSTFLGISFQDFIWIDSTNDTMKVKKGDTIYINGCKHPQLNSSDKECGK